MKNFKLIRTAFSMLMISILVFTMCSINAIAATPLLQNTLFKPGTTQETAAIVSDNGSQLNGDKNRFCDNNATITYRMPLNSAAQKANLLLSLQADYTINISTDNVNWTLFSARTSTGPNNIVLVIPLMSYISAGKQYIYFRLGDQHPVDGNGGLLSRAVVYYADYTPVDTTPFTAKTEFRFQANTNYEAKFIYADNGSSPKDGQYMRFTDNATTITYRLPYDSSKTAYLKALVGSNYMIWVSSDATNWTLIDKQAPNVISSKMLVYDLKDYKGKAIDYVYLRMGDQTTADGWGGNIYEVSLSYDSTKLYNIFDLTGVVYPATVLPSKAASSAKASTVKNTSTAISTVNSSISDISSAVSSSSTSDVSSNSVSSEITSSTAIPAVTTDPASNTIYYVLIIIGAIILLGGAVAQYIFMKKRKI
jgi:hypothetical protein